MNSTQKVSTEDNFSQFRNINKFIKHLSSNIEVTKNTKVIDISHFRPITFNQKHDYNILFRFVEVDMPKLKRLILPEIQTSINLPKREKLRVSIKYMSEIGISANHDSRQLP